MNRWLQIGGLTATLALTACVSRPVEKPLLDPSREACKLQPLFLDKDVDLLFVVDNSNSMEQEQKNLRAQFPNLIDALRTPKLGSDGSGKPCNATNNSGCKIPNVHIGVVNTDLGAGNYNLPSCEQPGGDQGRLQNKPKVAGCTPPKDKWISYNEGVTNVPSAGKDGVTQVKEAFSCIAEIGLNGCGFEQTLEATRRALDPTLNVNPGFLRNDIKKNQDAILAVVFITDEDDCSASNPQLFDPSQQGMTDPLGPLTSFRCFEFGVTCECAGGATCKRTTVGPRKNCVPGGKYLHKVSNYTTFFQNLKKTVDGKANPTRVLMAAISGPTNRVEVGLDGQNPSLKPSCQGAGGWAVPAIRIKTLVHAFARKLTDQEKADVKAKKVVIPHWIDSKGIYYEENFNTICTTDFSPALKRLGERIVGSLGTLCLKPPALTDNGGILCQQGDVIYTGTTCKKSCLNQANFTIQEVTAAGQTPVKKCSSKYFEQTKKNNVWTPKYARTNCGTECPCWRIVSSSVCKNTKGSSPYSVEIMRKGEAAKGTFASVCALSSSYNWGTKEFADLPQCN